MRAAVPYRGRANGEAAFDPTPNKRNRKGEFLKNRELGLRERERETERERVRERAREKEEREEKPAGEGASGRTQGARRAHRNTGDADDSCCSRDVFCGFLARGEGSRAMPCRARVPVQKVHAPERCTIVHPLSAAQFSMQHERAVTTPRARQPRMANVWRYASRKLSLVVVSQGEVRAHLGRAH